MAATKRKFTVAVAAVLVSSLAGLGSAAVAQDATASDVIYDIEVIRHLREANGERDALEKQAHTHIETYEAATARLAELHAQDDLSTKAIPEINQLYGKIITALDAVLANEERVRSLYRAQVDLLRDTLRRAKSNYLNGGNSIEASGQAAKNAEVLERRLATYAHKLRNKNLQAHWRQRYEALFSMALENKRIFDTTIGQLSAMEATTRKDAISKLEALMSRTYEDYLHRLVTYRHMDVTREQYDTSRLLLADISTVDEWKRTIEVLDKGQPQRFDLTEYGPQPGASQVLGRIVQGLVGSEHAAQAKPQAAESRKETLLHYAELYDKQFSGVAPATPSVQ